MIAVASVFVETLWILGLLALPTFVISHLAILLLLPPAPDPSLPLARVVRP